jgi:nicotinamide riboside transporter PnuC
MDILVLEWAGSILGVLGALILALNSRISGWGFALFLASNICWIAFAVDRGLSGLLFMQLVFTLTSLIGCWKWLLQPTTRR